MNFEGIEQTRVEHIQRVLESLTKIAEDATVDAKERIEAAKVVQDISDSAIRAYITMELKSADTDTAKTLLKSLEGLHDNG